MKNGEEASPSSSPPTPPSPLPVSVGPGNQRYLFSSSPSPPSSSHTSTEDFPLLKEYNASIFVTSAPSVFSLDRPWEPAESTSDQSSCLKDFAGWNGLYKDAAVAAHGS
ncbi:hypothetical protein Ancab_029241 [Ancistrocladus abbreviatus]